MAQSLDQSVASTTASSIYVIGQQQNDLPIELFYASRDAEFENRYDRTVSFFVNIDNNQGGNQTMQWTILQSDAFMRGRSMMAGFNFAVANLYTAGNLTATSPAGGYFALTPLPAFTVTYWDSIQMFLGYNATPVYTLSPNQHIPFMMRLMGHDKLTATNSTSLAMSGIFYFNNFDYNSGISGAAPATYPLTSTGNPGLGATYNFSTVVPVKPWMVENNQPPYNVSTVNGQGQIISSFSGFSTNGFTGTTPIRTYEGGLWQGEGMQKLRAAFYGNPNTTNIYGTVKLDVISECFMTPCVMPPVPITLKFNYPYPNSQRPRYINTPVVNPVTTAPPIVATNVGVVTDVLPLTYAGIVPNIQNCYMLYETVAFRADMHAAVLLAWKNNAGINDRFRSYDWYTQGQITSQTIQLNLIQANNFVSYQSLVGMRPQFPWALGNTYTGTGGAGVYTIAAPQLNQVLPYTWSDCNLKTITAIYTMPSNIAQQRILWQNAGSRPDSYSNLETATSNQRGIIDYQSAWNDCYQDQLWFTNPNYGDWRFNNQLNDRYLNLTQAPPVGFIPQVAASTVTQYGTHAYIPTPGGVNGTAWGTGPHNNFIQFNYNGQNFTEEIQDYGTIMGSLRMTLNFASTPPAPGLIFDHLMPYLININYQGTLNVTTSLQIN
jgi:hypothetical protein